MDSRQAQLLVHIMEEYVRSKEPVGSKFLAGKYQLDVSPATIRNDMAILEDEGFITQPHISAGRVPTERAYRYWIQHAPLPEVNRSECSTYEKTWDHNAPAEAVKSIAKSIVEYADGAVVVAFSPYEFYYTGLSALFRQPEFDEQPFTVSMARVIDHLDAILEKLVEKIHHQTVLIGRDNPFGKMCGFVGTNISVGSQNGCIGILGPQRMDYPMHMARMNALGAIINS